MRSRILLADDSITIQKVVNLTFADEGIDVIAVSNGEMAEKRLGEVNPDLVLADIFMPGKNGYELCETIKKNPQFRNVPVVLLVGAFEPFDQGEAKRVKADGHLTKPFESRTLVETVRKLIQSASSRPRTGPLPSVVPPPPQETAERADPLDTNPIAPPAPPFSTEPAAPEIPIDVAIPPLSETSPLDLDYGASPPGEAQAPEVSPPEADVIGQFEGPFVRTTGALTSVGPGAVHHASDNGRAEVRTDSPPEPTQSTTLAPATPPTIGVPSAFGDRSGDIILDFDTNPEPDSPSVSEPASAEDEESPLAVAFEAAVESGENESTTVRASERVSEQAAPSEPVVESVPVEPPVLESSVVEASAELPAAQTLVESQAIDSMAQSLVETEFVAIDAPVDEPIVAAPKPPPADLLQVDEPLGDVLSEAPAYSASLDASAVVEPPAQASSLDAPTAELPDVLETEETADQTVADLAVTPLTPVETIVEQVVDAPALDVLMPPPIAPSVFETSNVDWDDHHGGSDQPLSYVAEEPAVEQQEAPVATRGAEPESTAAEESFTASSMWTEPVDSASPIDIEATPVEDATDQALEQVRLENQQFVGGPSLEAEALPVQPESVSQPESAAQPEPGADHQVLDASAESAESTVLSDSTPLSVEPAVESASESQPVFPEPVMTDLQPNQQDAASSAASQSAMIDEIVRRVVAELSDSVVREIAWEVVPDCVERVVNQMTRDGVAKRA
jgi:CheY-like chemotaxis protein